ncbi:hypothetical protein M2G69_21085 [Vibrio vulnificus]|nr:hypothetical protein [Vibrio vulnificus]
MRGSIHPYMPEAAFGNTLTATNNDESETSSNNEARKTSHGARYTMGPRVREDDSVREVIRTTSNTNNKVLKPSHRARYTMGPRVREDDKNKKRKSRAKFNGKEQKTQHTAATPPTVIPAHAGIHTPTHARSRVGNTLTATDNDESEASSNTDNEVPKPSHGARYPMGPRVREDDSVRELIRTNSNTDNEVPKTSHGARYPMGPRIREDDGVRELIRTTSCHSRVYGDPFIHTCQKPRLEMYSPQQTTTKAKPTATPTMKCQNRATVLAIRWVPAFARMTE